MGKYREIKWHGRAGQGVVTAVSILAEVLARQGKFVQAFPDVIAQKQRPSILSFLRLSDSPIRNHSEVQGADTAVLMDVRLLLNTEIKEKVSGDAVYIVNTSYSPEFIKEKLNLGENIIYTLDADTIAREEIGSPVPNVPLMTVLVHSMNFVPIDEFRTTLKELLTAKLTPELAAANVATIDRALNEVNVYEP